MNMENLLYRFFEENKDSYKKAYLMDVNNIQELMLFVLFLITSIILFRIVAIDFLMVKSLERCRVEEQEDMLKIKMLLMINLIFQFLSYLEQIIGYAFQGSDVVCIIYYFVSYFYIVIFYIIYWQSSLIWIQLMNLKNSNVSSLITITTCFRKFPIMEIILIILAVAMFIFYLCKMQTIAVYIFFGFTTFILLTLLTTGFLFKRSILNQPSIPEKIQRYVKSYLFQLSICITSLIIIVLIRLIWNILANIPDFDHQLMCFKCDTCECLSEKGKNKEHPYHWLIYAIIYIPISNFIPVLLLNKIYHPKQNLQQKRKLIDFDY